MSAKRRKSKTGSQYLADRLVKKKWLSSRILAVVERFLSKESLRRALRGVVLRNREEVAEVLDIFETAADRRELDRILLSNLLARGRSVERPDCSIVIPVFNNGALTYSCLRALLLAKVTTTFEVIAVDNGSTDSAPEVLDEFSKCITLITNEHNRGFVDACNQGAAGARGEFLVFLNNDTRVTDGWLDRLRETAEDFDNVGAVGGKLLFPDNTIQEAGGIIFNDGSGVNYGKWDDPDALDYNFMRDVDYSSAACLLVRRDLFESLGGFDRRYAPAFYEDTDLCFGLRNLGKRVVYQPRCEVFHHEGATAGVDLDLGYKRFQKINHAKFLEKWQSALALQKAPSSRNLPAARDRRNGPRIVVFDAQLPSFDRDSGSLRIFSIVKALSRLGYRVTFVLRRKARFDEYGRALGGIGVRVVAEDDVWTELAGGEHDMAIVSRLAMAERFFKKIKKAAPRIPVVFDTVDVHFVRERRAAELSGSSRELKAAERTRASELALAAQSDLTIAITEADRNHLLAQNPDLAVEIIPNVHAPAPRVPSIEGRSALMFIGGFRHPPNADAMLYFTGEILPAIDAALGAREFLIVGSEPPAAVRALASEQIAVTGYVEETAPYFARSRVFVCPLRYGSGMKGKIGEALTQGVPVVTTPVGAEGMGLVHGETALIQEDPAAFAGDVVRLFNDDDLWMKLASRGREYVADRFGPAALEKTLRQILPPLLTP